MKKAIILIAVVLISLSLFSMKLEKELFSPALNVKSTVAVVNGEYLNVDFTGEALNILMPETREVLQAAVADAIEARGFDKAFISNIILYTTNVDNVVILPGKKDCSTEELRDCLFCCFAE